MIISAAGCAPSTLDSARPNIVVSTTDYEWLVRDLSGSPIKGADPRFDIQVINDNPDADPHEFEPSSKDRLLVANADLVIYIGNDVDQYMQPLLDSVGFPEENVIRAEDFRAPACPGHVLCLDWQANLDTNPHIWYDLDSDVKLAQQISQALVRINPSSSSFYVEALKTFNSQADKLQKVKRNFIDALYAKNQGRMFASPEPLADSLLVDLGLEPFRFGNSFANGVEIPVKQMQEFKRGMKDSSLRVFIANRNVEMVQAQELADYAKTLEIPVLVFNETQMCRTEYGDENFLSCFQTQMFRVAQALDLEVKGLYGRA